MYMCIYVCFYSPVGIATKHPRIPIGEQGKTTASMTLDEMTNSLSRTYPSARMEFEGTERIFNSHVPFIRCIDIGTQFLTPGSLTTKVYSLYQRNWNWNFTKKIKFYPCFSIKYYSNLQSLHCYKYVKFPWKIINYTLVDLVLNSYLMTSRIW